jgi:hypothetical protein
LKTLAATVFCGRPIFQRDGGCNRFLYFSRGFIFLTGPRKGKINVYDNHPVEVEVVERDLNFSAQRARSWQIKSMRFRSSGTPPAEGCVAASRASIGASPNLLFTP